MIATPPLVLPLLVLMSSGCVFLLAGTIIGKSRWWGPFALLALAVSTWFLSDVRVGQMNWTDAGRVAAGGDVSMTPAETQRDSTGSAVLVDFAGLVAGWSALGLAAAFMLMAFKQQKLQETAGQCYGFLLLAAAGVMLIGVANDLIALFVGMELVALPLSLLMFLTAEDVAAREASMRHFVLGLLSTALLLFGFSLIFGLAGSTNFVEIRTVLTDSYRADAESAATGSKLGIAALVLVFAAVAMRISAVPFHFGGPEFLETSSVWSAGLLSVLPKIAGFLILLRFCLPVLVGFEESGMLIAVALSAASLAVCSAMALFQSNLRRLLAYVVTASSGFVLVGVAVGFWSQAHLQPGTASVGVLDGTTAAVIQLAVFVVSIVVVYAVLHYLHRTGHRVDHVEDLRGLIRTEPAAAVCLLVALLSLAGIPPLPGFWARLLLLLSSLSVPGELDGSAASAPHGAFVALAILAAIAVLLLAAVLMRLIAVIFLEGRVGRTRPGGGSGSLAVAVVGAALLILAGLFPGACLESAQNVSSSRTGSQARIFQKEEPRISRSGADQAE
ncbi:MAG: hypothetical protein IID45_15465 [Planctomycetes bacterium]|nr:hypothetical protein [Planctomycetota bacterium]